MAIAWNNLQEQQSGFEALYDISSERLHETMKDSLCKMWPFGRLRDNSKAATALFMRSSLTKTFSTYNILRTFFVLFN